MYLIYLTYTLNVRYNVSIIQLCYRFEKKQQNTVMTNMEIEINSFFYLFSKLSLNCIIHIAHDIQTGRSRSKMAPLSWACIAQAYVCLLICVCVYVCVQRVFSIFENHFDISAFKVFLSRFNRVYWIYQYFCGYSCTSNAYCSLYIHRAEIIVCEMHCVAV